MPKGETFEVSHLATPKTPCPVGRAMDRPSISPPTAQAPHLGYWGHFALADKGLYFVDSSTEPEPTIIYYDFQSRRLKPIMMLKPGAHTWTANLSASRDGRTLLYAQFESRNSIMMADNLR
jgi:hypothetical protein